jgi:alkylated DNA repair dioxygenase AlkB
MTTVGSFSVSVLGSVPPCGCWPGLAVAAQVPPEQRETTARALQATTKRKVLPLVHISSGAYHPGGGGVGSGASDCGGEPVGAAVGPTLAGAAPPGTAVVVWRCFGGTPPSDADLQAAYHAAAKQAVAAYQATTPVQAQRPLPAGAGLQCRPPPPKGPCGPVSAPQTAAAVVAPNGEARGGHRPDDDSAALPTRSHVPEAKEVLTAVVPLPIPCVSYSADFLSRDVADKLLALFSPLKGGAIAWATSPRVNHATAIYGDGGIRYSSATTAGYASAVVNDWTSELLSLRDAAETWYRNTAGIAVTFNVCLLNRYDGGAESLGWHADREEMDPAMEAPRASPIASVSIGVPRQFGLRRHGATTVDVVRLGHGSLCVMENACQFLCVVPGGTSYTFCLFFLFHFPVSLPDSAHAMSSLPMYWSLPRLYVPSKHTEHQSRGHAASFPIAQPRGVPTWQVQALVVGRAGGRWHPDQSDFSGKAVGRVRRFIDTLFVTAAPHSFRRWRRRRRWAGIGPRFASTIGQRPRASRLRRAHTWGRSPSVRLEEPVAPPV